MLEMFDYIFRDNTNWKIDFRFDCALREEIKTLIKTKNYTKARELMLARIDEDFLEKSGAYYIYGPQTFTTYFIRELLKLLIKLGEKEEALEVYKKGLGLPHLKRENEIAFSLAMQSIYPQITEQHIPKYKEKIIERKVVSKKGKQKFLGKNGEELFVEEIGLEYYRDNGKWHGVWMSPSVEQSYFDRICATIGEARYKRLMDSVMKSMGHKCNPYYGALDLFLHKETPEKIGKPVEVKGPKDKLSAAQLVWIEQFSNLDLDCEVLCVKDMPSQL